MSVGDSQQCSRPQYANVCKQTYDASCMVCHFSVRKALKGIGSFSTCVHARTKLIRPNNREYSTKSPPCNASEHTRCCRQNVNHESSSTHIIDQNMHLVFYWIAASFHWQTQSRHVGRRRQAASQDRIRTAHIKQRSGVPSPAAAEAMPH